MNQEQLLCQTVAAFLQVDPQQLGTDYPLSARRVHGSIGRAALDAAIRRKLGRTSPAVYSARTYGELEQALLNASTPVPRAKGASEPTLPPPPAASSESGSASADASQLDIVCGIDIEMVENLPQVRDYWEDEFYIRSFTSAEIAYCTMQANPRLHFAARWCAKEALKKCDPALLSAEMNTLELFHRESGGPLLRQLVNGTPRNLPFAVSISHSDLAAVAVVLKPSGAPSLPSRPALEEAITDHPKRSSLSLLTFLLSVISLGLAVWACLRTL